jgi:predicted dithiol-disulfide oxidoreductase (DUF899 family)
MAEHETATRERWLVARRALLAREKELTRLRAEVARARRDLPWVRLDEPYAFDGPGGRRTLGELFDDRTQLIVYHFMFEPTWSEGCKSCSWWADNFERNVVHLRHRDVNLVAVSRASLDRLEAYKRRMGWTFAWYSSLGSNFNHDFHVTFPPDGGEYNFAPSDWEGEAPGISVFAKDEAGVVYHTYSCYSRGLDMMNAGYHYLDLVPKGRDEEGLSYGMEWLRRRDQYDDPGVSSDWRGGPAT